MKETRSCEPLVVNDTTVILLQVCQIDYSTDRRGLRFYVSCYPAGIVVDTRDGWKAVDTSGLEVPLEKYLEEFPDLAGYTEGR
jgi:hypothetical protein